MSKEIGRRAFLKQGALAGAIAATGLPALSAFAEVREQVTSRRSSMSGPVPASPPEWQLDSQAFTLSEYEQRPPALTFSATDAASAQVWQRQVRAKLVELVGGFPEERVDLEPEILDRKGFGSYTREKVIFQTRKNLSAVGYLLLPKGRSYPAPALVCLPGHGPGVSGIVGIAEDGSQMPPGQGDPKPFAVQAVEQGYVTFALEQLAFGERRDEAARSQGPRAYSCRPAAGAALLMGQTMIGWRVWDVMRTIDYLGTRPEVDTSRIGTLGFSGGGTTSLFAAALDERIQAGVVSGYFNTFRDSILSLSHCMCNYVPGILEHIEMYDLAGLVAPRLLFIESGKRDRIFPVEASRAAFAKAQEIYRVFGVPDRIGYEVWDGPHDFNGNGAFRFLAERFGPLQG